MVLCKYCDLEFKRRGYSEHVEACGSRTEPCEQCSLRVRLKDMQVGSSVGWRTHTHTHTRIHVGTPTYPHTQACTHPHPHIHIHT